MFFVFFCVKLTHEPCVFVCVSVSFKINTTTLYFSLYNVREKQDIAIISLKIILKNDVYGSNIFSQNNLGAFSPPPPKWWKNELIVINSVRGNLDGLVRAHNWVVLVPTGPFEVPWSIMATN